MRDTLLSSDLFSKVLLNPARDGARELYIISGYASSAMVFHHTEKLKEQGLNIDINLIIGMTCRDGLSKTNHCGFQSLVKKDLSDIFTCSYLVNHPPVHSKVYTWIKDGAPMLAFAGSANYSQQAFLGNFQREAVTECNPSTAYNYYKSLIDESIYCTHQDAEAVITLYNDYRAVNSTKYSVEEEIIESDQKKGLEHVTVPLINSSGNIYCLNWGFRKNNQKRNKNEAYIQLTPEIYRSNFFPKSKIHFTINTDDNKLLICTRAQKDPENGNAIETPHNNSLLGEYFRYRLGLPSEAYITPTHLRDYGRDSVDFYKIDEENYFMDFSV